MLSDLQDPQAFILENVGRTMRRIVSTNSRTASVLTRSASSILNACLAKAEATIALTGLDALNDHFLDPSMAPGAGGLTGVVAGHSGISRSMTRLFGEVVRTLEMPTQVRCEGVVVSTRVDHQHQMIG